MSFDLPRDVIFPVSSVEVELVPGAHPFEDGRRDEIAENWAREKEANPGLFNGEVALLSKLAYRDGALLGRCHMVRYATFLYWRKLRPIDRAEHAYAHAMLVSSDNALVAIRMARGGPNAGLAYFAAGSFDPLDFPEGRADLDLNMRREVLEETGLDLDGLAHDPAFHALSKVTGTVLFRRYFLPDTADDIAERIRRHVASETDPEIVGPVIIRRETDLPERLAPQMPGLIAWHFGREG
jgi:8-oxo-dGTP pyrophosphatase MutT (NUDIX family)